MEHFSRGAGILIDWLKSVSHPIPPDETLFSCVPCVIPHALLRPESVDSLLNDIPGLKLGYRA